MIRFKEFPKAFTKLLRPEEINGRKRPPRSSETVRVVRSELADEMKACAD